MIHFTCIWLGFTNVNPEVECYTCSVALGQIVLSASLIEVITHHPWSQSDLWGPNPESSVTWFLSVCNARLWWTQLGLCFISSVYRKANRVRKQYVPLITWWGWAACFWNEYLLSQSENETQTAWFFCFRNEQLAPVLSLLQLTSVEIKQQLFC